MKLGALITLSSSLEWAKSDTSSLPSNPQSFPLRALRANAEHPIVNKSIVDMRDSASSLRPAGIRALESEELFAPSMGDVEYELDGNTDDRDVLTLSGVKESDVLLSTDASNHLFITSKPEFAPPFMVTVKAQFEWSVAFLEDGYGFDRLVFDDASLGRDGIKAKASVWVGSNASVTHYGSRLDETFLFGAGSSSVWGNQGADTYVFARGSGNQNIHDEPQLLGGNNNQLVFENIARNEVDLQKNGIQLRASFRDQSVGGGVSVENQFYQDLLYGATYGVESISFSDIILSRTDINNAVNAQPAVSPVAAVPMPSSAPGQAPVGLPTAETVVQTPSPVLAANTSRYIQEGTDEDDRLFGLSVSANGLEPYQFANAFIAKKGNDLLFGSDDPDLYLFAAGDGQDAIYESVAPNELRFQDYAREDLHFFRDGGDLIVKTKDETLLDEVRVKGHFDGMNTDGALASGVVMVRFKNGDVLSAEEILQMITSTPLTEKPVAAPSLEPAPSAFDSPTASPTVQSRAASHVASALLMPVLATLATFALSR